MHRCLRILQTYRAALCSPAALLPCCTAAQPPYPGHDADDAEYADADAGAEEVSKGAEVQVEVGIGREICI
jgi:hypothetical protein